ncbi:MAG: DUF3159 domain-containing protein [Actinomycetales bacterium]|nr:DUF3159 domain-containing protein [Actinomycetales bacterium]
MQEVNKPHADEQVSRAAKLGLRVDSDGIQMDATSLLATVGGRLGLIESLLPSTLFMITWVIWRNPQVSIGLAILPVLFFGVYRLAKRGSLMQVLFGGAVAGLSAWMALSSGSTREYFIPGFITNLAYLIPLLISVLVRWPVVGLLLGFLIGEGTSWRKKPREMKLFTAATLVLTSVFAIRLAVEVPLYLANEIAALAVTKIVLGYPLYAIALWTAWLLVRRVISERSN